MLLHLDLEPRFEDLFGQPCEQPAGADQIDPVRLRLGDELLRERPINTSLARPVGFLHHDHIMVCHCLSFRLNHDDSACQAKPVTPRI